MNHVLKFLSVFLLIVLSSFSVQAESVDFTADFKAAARSIPESLRQSGYNRIGKINLKNFIKNIETLNVEERAWVETAMPEDQRRIFARWEITAQGPKVIINTTTWDQAFPQHLGTLALHELLGAHGFDDEDYNLSTAMWLLAVDAKKKVMTAPERRYVEKKISELSTKSGSGGGGVIGVGGGGDMMGPALKLTMLESAYQDYEKNPSEEIRAGLFRKFQVTQMFSVEGGWKWR